MDAKKQHDHVGMKIMMCRTEPPVHHCLQWRKWYSCKMQMYLDFVHETSPVPLAQQSTHKSLGFKPFKFIHVLTWKRGVRPT